MKVDYKAVVAQALQELGSLLKERQELDLQLAHKEQFIRAAMIQLPEDVRRELEKEFDNLAVGLSGLSASIRSILSSTPRKWRTATEVRDDMLKAGFDFGNYSSNPLASVHSVLRRLKSEEAEMTTRGGVMVWRLSRAAPNPRRGLHRRISLAQAMAQCTPISLANLVTELTNLGLRVVEKSERKMKPMNEPPE